MLVRSERKVIAKEINGEFVIDDYYSRRITTRPSDHALVIKEDVYRQTLFLYRIFTRYRPIKVNGKKCIVKRKKNAKHPAKRRGFCF